MKRPHSSANQKDSARDQIILIPTSPYSSRPRKLELVVGVVARNVTAFSVVQFFIYTTVEQADFSNEPISVKFY